MPGPCNGSKRYSLPHAVYTRSIVMVTIPIHNETTYTLTDVMTLEILRDAHDHFGEEVHAIRVQSGLARHALNARTREVRYAFSPRTLALVIPCPSSRSRLAHGVVHLAAMRRQRQRSSQHPSRTLPWMRRNSNHSKR